MKIVTVHGFNVRDKGRDTVDQLLPYALDAGFDIDVDGADYGYFNLFMIRLTKTRQRNLVIQRIAEAAEKADVIITHSNGANFATQALDRLPARYNNSKILIHYSPALDRDTPIPNAVKGQLVLYTPHDGWVRLSSLIPFDNPWGSMGAKGYNGGNTKNTNIMDKRILCHSCWFHVKHIYRSWKYAADYIKEFSQ